MQKPQARPEADPAGAAEHRVDAVLFDAMGTLVELAPPGPALARELQTRLGVQVSLERAERAIAAEISYYRAHLDEGHDEPALADLRTRCARVVADELSLPELYLGQLTGALMASLRFGIYRDVIPVLQSLSRRGVRLAVVSNWDVSLVALLERLGVSALVDAVIVSAVVGARKPAPEIFHAATRSLGIPPESAVHVGDGLEEDVGGASGAGIRAVWLRRAGADPAQAMAPPGVATIESLEELQV